MGCAGGHVHRVPFGITAAFESSSRLDGAHVLVPPTHTEQNYHAARAHHSARSAWMLSRHNCCADACAGAGGHVHRVPFGITAALESSSRLDGAHVLVPPTHTEHNYHVARAHHSARSAWMLSRHNCCADACAGAGGHVHRVP